MKIVHAQLLILTLVAVAAGCKTTPPDPLESQRIIDLGKAWKEPVKYSVLFAIEEADVPPVEEVEEASYRVRPDSALIEEYMWHVLEGKRWFTKAVLLRDSRKTPTSARAYFLSETISRGADYLVLMSPGKFEVRYTGMSSSFIWGLLVWSLFVPPSWWIPDETFKGTFTVSVEVVDAKRNPGETREIFTISKDVTRNLNDFARGWKLTDFLPTPGLLFESNYVHAGSLLSEWFLHDFVIEVLEKLMPRFAEEKERERERTPPPVKPPPGPPDTAPHGGRSPVPSGADPSKQPPPPRTAPEGPRGYSLVAGVTAYPESERRGCSFCAQDAKALHAAFANIPAFSESAENMRILLDSKANRKNLQTAVRDIVSAEPGEKDVILVYFSGCGATLQGEGGGPATFLVPAGVEKADAPSELVPVEEICRDLSNTKAGRIIVILDAGFCGGRLRSMGSSGIETARDAVNALRRISEKREGFSLLLADDGSGEALELAGRKQGLFTAHLLDALKGGHFDPAAFGDHVSDAVQNEADLMARKQTPVIAVK